VDAQVCFNGISGATTVSITILRHSV